MNPGAIPLIAAAILLVLGTMVFVIMRTSKKKTMPRSGWEIGPVINGNNYSHGAKLTPSPVADSFTIDIAPDGSAHYVTKPTGPLLPLSTIVIDFSIDRPLMPTDGSGMPILTAYIQRRGDNWSATGVYETYRWYATFDMAPLVEPGRYTVRAPLYSDWTAVITSSAYEDPQAFAEALINAERVGFVLGGGNGVGHGVNGPGRITVHQFRIE